MPLRGNAMICRFELTTDEGSFIGVETNPEELKTVILKVGDCKLVLDDDDIEALLRAIRLVREEAKYYLSE